MSQKRHVPDTKHPNSGVTSETKVSLWSLFGLHFSLGGILVFVFAFWQTVYSIHYTLCSTHYTRYIIHYTVDSTHYALHTMPYTVTVYTIHYALYTMYYTLRTITLYCQCNHECQYEFHNENGRRTSRAKRGQRGFLLTQTRARTWTQIWTPWCKRTGSVRAERSEASEAPPLRRHEYEHEYKHDCEYELHNENGRRASQAKRGERGAPPYTDINTNRPTFQTRLGSGPHWAPTPLC